MTILKRIYHFLGSINFAITLLATTAILVILGTFIESHTDSHRAAANYIYGSPLFGMLLWGFFINIFISSCRRWPFKLKHIPFLTTHLGLLMVLAGCLVKNYYGIQGNMTLVEGSGSHHLTVPESHRLVIESREKGNPKNLNVHEYEIAQSFAKNRYQLKPVKRKSTSMSNLSLKLFDYQEHSKEIWKSWFKGDYAYIQGLPPLPVETFSGRLPQAPIKTRLNDDEMALWNVYAIRTNDIQKLLSALIISDTNVLIKNQSTGQEISRLPLKSLLEKENTIENLTISAVLSNAPLNEGSALPMELTFKVANGKMREGQMIALSLHGERALENRHTPHVAPGILPLKIELEKIPTVALVENSEGEVTLIAVNRSGQVHVDTFPADRQRSILVYDDGFGGYSVQSKIPFAANAPNLTLIEAAKLHRLTQNLDRLESKNGELSPPLEHLKLACEKAGTDFIEIFLHFLTAWNNSHHWLASETLPYPKHLIRTLENFDWKAIPKETFQSCFWMVNIISNLEAEMAQGKDGVEALRAMKWPLIDHLNAMRQQHGEKQPEETELLLQSLTQQILYIAANWPDTEATAPQTTSKHTEMLSAYFRLYHLDLQSLLPALNPGEKQNAFSEIQRNKSLNTHLNALFPPLQQMHLRQKIDFLANLPENHRIGSQMHSIINQYYAKEEKNNNKALSAEILTKFLRGQSLINFAEIDEVEIAAISNSNIPICLECPITAQIDPSEPNSKLEKNIPKITLIAAENGKVERLSLSYDPQGNGLKWPLLFGSYRVRFQPQTIEIPYHLRLRNATQKNYANTNRPQSYQCSLLVTNRNTGDTKPQEISMNHVYESPEGYRFYLSNISPSDESQVKKIQIVVNYDPAKYLLTYPGGIVVAMGIGLLFWLRPYRK
jgi:hypothetical protein